GGTHAASRWAFATPPETPRRASPPAAATRSLIRLGLFARVVQKISDHPVLFIFLRGILENDFRAIRATIPRELDLGPGVRTLDMGCGPGAFADLFEKGDYVGVDLNARYIDHARGRYKGAFVVGDARKVDLPDGRFDQILIFGLLHHLP